MNSVTSIPVSARLARTYLGYLRWGAWGAGLFFFASLVFGLFKVASSYLSGYSMVAVILGFLSIVMLALVILGRRSSVVSHMQSDARRFGSRCRNAGEKKPAERRAAHCGTKS